jgi:hypothetical protein
MSQGLMHLSHMLVVTCRKVGSEWIVLSLPSSRGKGGGRRAPGGARDHGGSVCAPYFLLGGLQTPAAL